MEGYFTVNVEENLGTQAGAHLIESIHQVSLNDNLWSYG